MNFKPNFTYRVNGTVKYASGSNEDFSVKIENDGTRYKVTVIPARSFEFVEFKVQSDYRFSDGDKFFANGFQSWTDTKEFKKNEKMPDIGFIGKTPVGKFMGLKYVGDYTFVQQPKTAGVFHSHGFSYVAGGDKINLIGSLNEKTGFTVIKADMNENTVSVYKDLECVVIKEPYEAMNLFIKSGNYDAVFDEYFNAMGVKPLTDKKLKGYTSWYNYYQDINETCILRDLDAISKVENINVFQVDDGYQTAVGDWFSIDKKKFPGGMKNIADCIHNKNLKAGLWLAPFGAQKGSVIAKEHTDWLIKDEKGKPICVGGNWGGFYALDIYNKDARSYIKKVFNEVLNVWGFDLVKLDFLYAASIVPMYNKSRGEIACDAMELLRGCVGEKQILACGCPMLPAFGKAEYMRIGADMSLSWKHSFLRNLMHREDVSTPNALLNSVYRRCLNGRAFLCDPDVFLLRRTNIKFSPEQQKAIAEFIRIFGCVLFTSDNITDYDKAQLDVLNKMFGNDEIAVTSLTENDGNVKIKYTDNGSEKSLSFNANSGLLL